LTWVIASGLPGSKATAARTSIRVSRSSEELPANQTQR
jgi:hypothetical protein